MDKKTKWWLVAVSVAALVVLSVLAMLPILAFVLAIPNPDSVELDKPVATQLVRDFNAYGKIYSMDDCTCSQKYLNDTTIRMTVVATESDTLSGNETTYYKEALRQQGIPEATFESFRKRLESTQLRDYHRSGPYSLFVVDGYTNHEWGYLHATGPPLQPQQQLRVGNHLVSVVESLGDNWYRTGSY